MTLIYSRKAYNKDKEFAKIVESTALEASSQEHHTELIQEYYPNLIVTPYYTYEHGGMIIESFMRCDFDSSVDAFVATDDEKELKERLLTINEDLQGYCYDD